MAVAYRVVIMGKGAIPPPEPNAMIELLDESTKLGSINFFDPQSPIPADTQGPSGGVEMNLPLAMFSAVVDLLRNEGPVALSFVNGRGRLRTGPEAVGEGETIP
jgi:hypothetical protein